MDYIAKIRKDKRRFLGFKKPQTKYQRRKEHTIMDFLFFQKKQIKRQKLNQFQWQDIWRYLAYIKKTKRLADATIKEKEKILKSFYRRNFLGLEKQG